MQVNMTTKCHNHRYQTNVIPRLRDKRTHVFMGELGPVAQLVASQIADPGVVSLTAAWPHTFVEIDHELFSTIILLLPLIQEGLLSVISDIYIYIA